MTPGPDDLFTRGRGQPGVVRLALAALLLDLVLILPNHPDAMTWAALKLVPLELPAILSVMLVLPGRGRIAGLLPLVLALVLGCGMVLKLADLATFTAFNRPFNLLVDLPLVAAGWTLLSGNVGTPAAAGAIAVALLAVVAATAASGWAMAQWRARRLPRRLRPVVGLVAGIALAVMVVDIGHVRAGWRPDPPGAAFTARLALEEVESWHRTAGDLAEFRAATRLDPVAEAARDGVPLFDRLQGRDLIVLFVESYGRTSFDTAFYRDSHLPVLRHAEAEIGAAGLSMRSGYLRSPIEGGQSWLAHGTVASGLRIGDQTRYGALLRSGRETIWSLAGAAGLATTAVMPAISYAWPEGTALGFGQILAADDMGYRGRPFNWITMPDQYTLSVIERRLAAPGHPQTVLQSALISSHAPWTPVARMRDWADVGDGRIFDGADWPDETPESVWSDPDDVRAHYRDTIAYSLTAVGDFAARQGAAKGGRAPLIVVLGDHQPAGFVSQMDSRDVPVHVIGPADLVDDVAGDWATGLVPDATAAGAGLETLRDRLIRGLSAGLPAPQRQAALP
ncbi:sulfatase [Frigidibacter sp. MR17.24]|uniref:sulfatase n=1 Tax=Frigidibacter sp. MR17.24 TaxID=3127345 RepID=UPI003012B4F6